MSLSIGEERRIRGADLPCQIYDLGMGDVLDDLLAEVYSWGNRFWVEIGVTIAVFLLVHFLLYPIVLRRHERQVILAGSSAQSQGQGTKLPEKDSSPAATPKSTTESTTVSEKKVSHKPETPTVGPLRPPPAPVQSAPGGINIGGNNLGTAIVNNYRPAPLSITQSQLDAVTDAAKAFQGSRIDILWELGSPEVDRFGRSLVNALGLAGLLVEDHQALIMLTPGYTRPQPGLTFVVPSASPQLANAIARALDASGYPVPERGFRGVAADPKTAPISAIFIAPNQ